MLKYNRVQMASCKLDQNLDVNLGSRSETIDIGTPCNLTISSTYNWANLSNGSCHTPIPGPTRLADPNRVRGVRPYTRTLYLIFF